MSYKLLRTFQISLCICILLSSVLGISLVLELIESADAVIAIWKILKIGGIVVGASLSFYLVLALDKVFGVKPES